MPWILLVVAILVIAGLGWAQLSREVRSKTMSMAKIDYVRAAQAVAWSAARTTWLRPLRLAAYRASSARL